MERGWSWWSLGNRPAVFPVVAALLGTVAGPFLEWSATSWFLLTMLALGLVFALRMGSILAGLLAAFAVCAGLAELHLDVSCPPLDRRVIVEGTIDRLAAHGLMLDAHAVDESAARFRVGLSRLDEHALPAGAIEGAVIRVETKLRTVTDAQNPGETSRAEWAWRRGQPVTGSFLSSRVVVVQAAPAWRGWMTREQLALERDTMRLSDDVDGAALLLTLSAGRRAALDDDLEEAFARSGLAHVLSVSGLHVGVLALAAFGALRFLLSRRQTRLTRLREPRAWAAPLAIPLVWLYVLFTGWQAPAVRSAVMCSLVLLAWAARRRSDALNALAVAALAMVMLDPASPFELSVQLSFAAVLGLILLAPGFRAALPIESPAPSKHAGWSLRWRRWREAVLQTACSSVGVTLASGPLVAAAFQRVSLAGLASNIVTLPLSGALTLVAALGAAVHVVSSDAAVPVLWVGIELSRLLIAIAEAFARLPGGTAQIPSPPLTLMVLWWLALGAWVFLSGKWRWLVIAAPAVLAFHLFAPTGAAREARVTFLAVGHGDAIVVSSGGKTALIDGGGVPQGHDTGRRFVLPFLRQARVEKLSLAVLTHAHPDHALGLISTLDELPTERLWLPSGSAPGPLVRELMSAAGEAEIEEKEAGEPGLQLGEIDLEVLGPPRDRSQLEGENDRSMVLLVRHGEVTFLLTGDIERAAEASVDVGEVTVVKAPHHGSDTSSTGDFVNKTRPKHVVFCVGQRNRFHFPRADVMKRWQAAGARCHRTDLDGAITFVSDGREVRVETFQTSERRARRAAHP